MSDQTQTVEQPHLTEPALADPKLTSAWLLLGITALAIAGIFAVLLVLSRTPGIQEVFPWVDFFRTALVVHVDQSVLIWFLAFGGAMWTLGGRSRARSAAVQWIAWGLAASGTGVIALAPFLGAGDPLINNYVPVLRHPLFFLGVGGFLLGVLLQAAYRLAGGTRVGHSGEEASVLQYAAATAAVATLAGILSLTWSYFRLPPEAQGEVYFEYLFWSGGHVLQFTYTQLLLLAWLWLSWVTGAPRGVERRVWIGLLSLGVAPVLLVPLIHGLYPVFSGESRLAFTRLMQYGGGVGALPIGLLVVIGLLRSGSVPAAQRPLRYALWASLLLFAVGGGIGWMITGVNTVIPAHYHGSIVGVTLALMGLTYHLLPMLGFAPVTGRLASVQPLVYAAGQLLHVLGLAVSGALGIQRKTAGAEQGLDSLAAILSMGVMGVGGLLAVIGGILFVVVVLRSVLHRPQRHPGERAGGR